MKTICYNYSGIFDPVQEFVRACGDVEFVCLIQQINYLKVFASAN